MRAITINGENFFIVRRSDGFLIGRYSPYSNGAVVSYMIDSAYWLPASWAPYPPNVTGMGSHIFRPQDEKPWLFDTIEEADRCLDLIQAGA